MFREMTWRLLACAGERYDARWANTGRDVIRDDFSRLYLLESGRAEVRTERERHVLEPGTLWLIPGGVPARYRCVEPMRLNWVHFNVFVVTEVDLLTGGAPRSVSADRCSVERFHALLEAMEAGRPDTLALALAHLGELAAAFFPRDWKTLLPDSNALQRLRPVLDRIASGYAQDCSLTDLARGVNLHPVYFSRLFRRTLGVPPAQYVTAVRMRRAATLLWTTHLPVKAVAAQCGYPDPYHFSRAFKGHTGVSPAAYRAARSR
jgi:AraC-like DNA-binding protein